jgi:uncharacterized protein YkwD
MKTLNSLKYLCLFVAFTFTLGSCTTDSTNEMEEMSAMYNEVDNTQYTAMELEMLKLINEHRASLGLKALKTCAHATMKIREHNQYMMDQGEISHDNFDDRATYLKKVEHSKKVGENVASGDRTAKAVVDGLLNSPGHKANIEGNYSHIGLAVTTSNENRIYFGQLFHKK